MPHFQRLTEDGENLGPVELSRHEWRRGSVIYCGDGSNLRVLERLEHPHAEDDPELFAILVVGEV
jgi:hypothetical protein